MKPVPYKKRRSFFKLLAKGRAKLGERTPAKKSGRRGKGKFSCFWVKSRGWSKKHWIATFRFNQVFKRMIQKKQINPETFELCELPLYFVVKDRREGVSFPQDKVVSHYIKGFDLDENNLVIASKLKAPLETVGILKSEIWLALEKVFSECQTRYADTFSYFNTISFHNVVVQSFDKKTGKFKVFVVDV